MCINTAILTNTRSITGDISNKSIRSAECRMKEHKSIITLKMIQNGPGNFFTPLPFRYS